MSDLFDKFVFDLQRFVDTVIPYDAIGSDSAFDFHWPASEGEDEVSLLTFAAGSDSAATLSVTVGESGIITALNGVTLDATGNFQIENVAKELPEGEDEPSGSVKVYQAVATGSISDSNFSYEFKSPDNAAYFVFESSDATSFDFTSTGAGLKMDANTSNFTEGLTYNGGTSFSGDFQVNATAGSAAWLDRTSDSEFVVSGLTISTDTETGEENKDSVILVGSKQIAVGGGTGNAAVAFSVTNSGVDNFTGATVDADTAIEVSGMSGEDLAINGASVNVNVDYVFTRIGGTSKIDLSEETAPADGFVVTKTGNATQVGLSALSGANVTIVEDAFTANVGASFFFEVDSEGATGVSGIATANDSVTGAFFKREGFTFNGESVGLTTQTPDNTYTYSLNTLSGLVNGDEITEAGSISKFITKAIKNKATFGVLSSAVSFAGNDDDGVEFNFNGGNFAGVSGLNKGLSVAGDFTNSSVTVNGKTLDTNDDNLTLYGMGEDNTSASGIGKIAGFTGSDGPEARRITDAGGASSILTDGAGQFMVGTQGFSTAGDNEIEFVMQGGDSTTVLGISGFGGEEDATLSGALSTVWIHKEGNNIDVTGDEDKEFTYMYKADGSKYILGGVSGSDVKINGTGGADIVQVTGSGSYAFNLTGGTSAAFEVALGGDSDGVEFWFEDGKLTGISSVDKTAKITGNFSGSAIAIYGKNEGEVASTSVQVDGDTSVVVNHDAFQLEKLSNGAYIVQAEGISYAYTDALEAGSLSVKDASGDVFTIKAAAAGDSVMFILNGHAKIIGVSSLGADVSLEGGLSALTTINGETFAITGDSIFGVVGSTGASGIGVIYNLGGPSVTITNAGGASQIITDDVGSFFFADNAQNGIEINDDSIVIFGLSKGSDAYVTSIDSLSGRAEADHTLFENGGISVNGQAINITGDEGDLEVGGNSTVDGITYIAQVGGDDVVISSTGGAKWIWTDKDGTFTFGEGGQSFATGGGDSSIGFALNGLSVTGIDAVGADEFVRGNFSGVEAVNGQSFAVENDTDLKIWGVEGESGIGMIDNLSGSAVVTATGGASIARTDEVGTFTFGSTSFKLEGDDTVVDFVMDTASAPSAVVTGVTDFGLSNGTNVAAKITGALSGIYINEEGKKIDVVNDADQNFSYAVDAEGFATLGGVSGNGTDVVEINNAGGASFIAVEGGGSYQFFSKDTFTVGLSAGDTDGLLFGTVDEKVVSIDSFEKNDKVTGNFDAGVVINKEGTVQILGDSAVTLFYDDIIIRDLTTGATLSRADNINQAWTDVIGAGSSFEVTDASGDVFTVTADVGGTSIMFVLENANIVGVSGLTADMTLLGSASVFESGFTVNGLSVVVKNDSDGIVGVVGSESGADGVGIDAIVNLSDSASVEQAGSASYAFTDTNGTFTFTNGEFEISGDSAVQFVFVEGANVDKADVGGVSQFTGEITAGASFFETFTVNGQSVIIKNDADDMTVIATDESGIAGISKVGPADNAHGANGVQVINAGGASYITTDKTGGFSFAASGQEFQVYGDSAVDFVLNSESAVEAINGFAQDGESAAIVLGQLNDVVINGSASFDVAVNGSTSGVNLGYATYGGAYYLATYGTAAGASVAINKAGEAGYFATSNEGEFTFAGNSTPFTVAGDSSVLFELTSSDPATAAGVSYLGVGEASGGLSHVGGNVAATITGELQGFAINGSNSAIDVTGDANNIFSYAVDNSGIGSGEHATLGNVAPEDISGTVAINGTGGASVVEITGEGTYNFFGAQEFTYESDSASETFSGDSVAQFLLDGQTVGAINSFDTDDTVVGGFSSKIDFNPISGGVSGKVQVTGDDEIEVTNDGEALIINKLSNKAVFGPSAVVGVKEAWTDVMASGDSIAVTDAVGNSFTVSGEDADGVQFLVDKTTGAINGVSSLDEGVTLAGALDALNSINGRTFNIQGDSSFVVVGSESAQGIGAIYGLGSSTGVTINNAGGASQIFTDAEGPFYFRQGSQSSEALYGVTLGTDTEYEEATLNDKAVFALDPDQDSYAFGVSGLNDDENYAQAAHEFFEDGFTVNGKSVVINGDEGDLVVYALEGGSGIELIANVGGSNVEIIDMGGAYHLVTDKTGTFTFGKGGTSFATGGDSYVGFMTEVGGTSVVEIMGLGASGWVESDKLNKLTINNSEFDIENDEGTMQVFGKGELRNGDDWDNYDGDWEDEFGNGITKIAKVGNASGTPVIVNSAGSAATIETDQNGEFQFASGQNFTLNSTDGKVSEFLMDGSHSASVTGIEKFEDGTIAFNTVTTALSVNTLEYAAQNMSFGTTSSVTLTVDPYQVVAVDGITAGGYVSGVVGNGQDATVWAEGPVTVNGEFIDITDSDSDYGIIVRSGDSSTLGTAQEAVKVTGDATVNVDNFTVSADGSGDFLIGGESFEFTDAEDEFKFTTDADKKLESVDSLNGTLVDYDGAVDLDGFNGDGPIVISDNTSPATLTGNNEHLTRIDTLDSGAVITGDVSNADIIMVGDSEVGNSIPSELTVNGNTYELYDDSDGITIRNAGADGIGTILGLDEGTSLKVSTGGVYTVNDKPTVFSGQNGSPSVKAGDVIIGIEDTQSAYIYDASNPLIREKTPLDEIERITGIPSDGYDQIGGQSTTTAHPTTGIPLNIAESDIIQGFRSASAADTLYPYVTSRDEYRDTLDLDQPLEIWIDNKESPVDTNQDLDLSKTRYAKKVHMYGGTQSVELNNDGGNLVHIESVASGHKTVDLGDGGDVVVMDETAAVGNSVSIVGGLKNDSIFVRDSANTTVDVSAGGADKIITYANAGARVTVVGYEPSMEGGIRIDELQSTDMLAAIMGQSSGLNINFGDGVVSIENTNSTNHSEVSLGSDANNATFVNLFDYKNYACPVGFTGTDGGTLDVGSTENDPLILVGNYKGNKTAGSVILGGAGPDIVLAGGQDSVDARGGNNTVILQDNEERDGAVIAFTQGRTAVHNMNNTLAASTGDTIVLSANNIKNFLFDGEDVTIDGNGFYGILENVDAEEGAEGKYVTQYIYNSDNSTVYKAAGAEAGAIIYLPTDEDVRPNAFFGMNSGINFGNYADPQTVMIDLKGDMAESSIGGSPIYTRGITGLYGYYYDTSKAPVATTENLIFKGSDANDTLVAGNGNTSLYGDGGKNWLVGSYDYDETLSDKEGRVTFFVIGNANGAANTISNFEYVSDNNYKDTSRVTADQIEILEEQSEVVYADVSGNNVYIEVASFGGENKESVVLEDAIDTLTGYGKDFIVSGNVAQVGKDKVLVDRFGEFYMATEKNATIDVKEEGSPVTVWLDNPETGKTFRGDFAVINASTLTSNAQLAGLGTKENTIIGGLGNNSLWGGEGSSNDVLIGGAGKNTFFYGLGNGQDTIEANDGDEVVLGISIDDIVESQSSIGDTSLTLKLRDGGSLTVNDDGGIVDYKLTNSEGVQETYYLDSNRQFKQR